MNSTNLRRLAALSAAVLLLGSSAYADLFGRDRSEKGSGDVASETREVEEFNRIRLDGSCDLRIKVGDEQKVVVSGDDNLLDNIVTEVVGRGTLEVDTRRSYSTRRGMLVEISVPHLDRFTVNGSGDSEIIGLNEEELEIKLNGSGDVEIEGMVGQLEIALHGSGDISASDLTSETVTIRSRGSGDIDLEGKAEQMEISLHGSGDINARRLVTRDVYAEIHGSGDVSVYADSSFDGSVYGSGDIDVYGDPPDLSRHVTGSGDISKR